MLAQKEKIRPVGPLPGVIDFKHQLDGSSRSAKLTPKRSRKKTGRFFLLPVLLAGIAYLINLGLEYSHNSNLFLVRTIRISGNDRIADPEILSLAKIKIGTPLGKVDLSLTEQKILLNPYIKTVSVSRSLPASVEIRIEERKPIAFLNVGELIPIDEEGVLLPYLSGGKIFDLPVLSRPPLTGKTYGRMVTDPVILNAVRWLKTIRQADEETYYRISELDLNGEAYTAYLTQGGTKIIFGETPLNRQMVFLKAAIGELEAENKIQSTQYIDLRFQNQIVIKEKTPTGGG